MSAVQKTSNLHTTTQILEGKNNKGPTLIIEFQNTYKVKVPQTLDREADFSQVDHIDINQVFETNKKDIETDKQSFSNTQEYVDHNEYNDIETYNEEENVHIEKKSPGCASTLIGGFFVFQVAQKVFCIAFSVFHGTISAGFFVVILFLGLYILYKPVTTLLQQGYDYHHNGSDFYPYTWKNIKAQFTKSSSP